MNVLQIKARCDDTVLVARQMTLLGSAPTEQLVHVDTYFRVPVGRLMLREFRESIETPGEAYEASNVEPPRRPQLIATVAATTTDRGESGHAADGSIVRAVSLLQAKNAAEVRDIYARMFGIAAVIKKARTTFPFHDVNVQVDEVVGLGNFVEVHAPLGEDANAVARARDQASGVMMALSLPGGDIVAASYVELLPTGD